MLILNSIYKANKEHMLTELHGVLLYFGLLKDFKGITYLRKNSITSKPLLLKFPHNS